MPKALRRAVSRNRVPNDIEPDLLFLASLLDPLMARIVKMAPDLPEKARQAREQIEPAAEKTYNVRDCLGSSDLQSVMSAPRLCLLPYS